MNRTVDLVSYLPQYLRDFKEIVETLKSENAEFALLWSAAAQTLYNLFIETADGFGLSKFEEMLGIIPNGYQNLEQRRDNVRFKWYLQLPYTWLFLVYKLNLLCGEGNYTISNNFDSGYTLNIDTSLQKYGQVDELETLLDELIPMNIVYVPVNHIDIEARATFRLGGGVTDVAVIMLTHNFNETNNINANAKAASAIGYCDFIEIK